MKKYLFALAVTSFAFTTWATPPNQPILDGRPIDYDTGDLRGIYTGGGGSFGASGGLTNLFVTWDTNYLYLALQGFEINNKMVIMLDVDPTNPVPTGATTTTNWVRQAPSYLGFNDVGWKKSDAGGAIPFGLDYMLSSEGFYNNALRILYDGLAAPDTNNVQRLFDLTDAGNGAAPQGTPVDMAAFTFATSNDLTGFEVRIPWSEIYGANTDRFGVVQAGEIVPRGALLRLFANIHNNDSNISFSASDTIPRQTSGNASYAAGLLTSDDYTDVLVDGDGDGMPDLVCCGDQNAPFIRFLQGAAGVRAVYAQFNEALDESTATALANWSLAGNTPTNITMTQTNGVLLLLTNDLPAAGSLVRVIAAGVKDTSGNTKSTYNYLTVAAGGLSTSVTVRFYLETASGLGLNPGSTNFFVNGGALPLEFGFPPSTSSPLSQYTGSLFYRDVTFPPGTPVNLNYKYSGILTGTGTNTYEAIRLKDFGNASRVLTLNTNGTSMVVTDYLGAAAGPYRNTPGTNTGYNALFADPNRGDAGVRERLTMTFQVDLRDYSLSGVSRVLIQGCDPVRGFNSDAENPPASDFATAALMSWTTAGLTMYDDNTHGDTNAGDKIYARQWVFSTNGFDVDFEPTFPNSLVGGGEFDPPYYGETAWAAGRSPKSFAYKFYVYKSDGSSFDSQGGDIEYYIQGDPTNIVLPPFAWNNSGLPLPPPSNSPTMLMSVPTSANTRVIFTNQSSELQHGIQVSTNLALGWLDYGQRADGGGGIRTAIVQGVGLGMESFRAFAGPGNPQRRAWWTPNPIPATGAALSVYFDQNYRTNAGQRDVRWFGRILGSGFTNLIPMTFTNQGGWATTIPVGPATNNSVQFLFVNPQITLFDKTYNNKDFYVPAGGRVTWTPEMPTQGGLFTVTFYATNSPTLIGATQVLFHNGFDNFQGVTMPKMTNIIDPIIPGIWQITIPVPVGRSNAVDWVFQNGATVGPIFDNNSTFDWRAFILQP